MAETTSTTQSLDAPKETQFPVGRLSTRAERVHALMGKFAWIPFSSDDYVREKQEELEREELGQKERE